MLGISRAALTVDGRREILRNTALSSRKRCFSPRRTREVPRYMQKRNPVLRFLNPWVDVAYMWKEKTTLGVSVAQYTETWGLVSVLLCGLSLSALVGMPHNDPGTCESIDEKDDTTSSAPIIVPLCGTSRQSQHDAYILSCTSAFFAAASSLGLTTVLNVIVTVTPSANLREFVVRHSWQLCAIPCLAAVSGGLVGLALAIGVDWTNSRRISKVVVAEFGLTTLLVACSVDNSDSFELWCRKMESGYQVLDDESCRAVSTLLMDMLMLFGLAGPLDMTH